MHRRLLSAAFLVLLGFVTVGDALALVRLRRQTYVYPEELVKYAQVHPGTKVYQGTVGRYAPEEWPKWYSRNMMKWDGDYRLSPYEFTDSRYPSWFRNRAAAVAV